MLTKLQNWVAKLSGKTTIWANPNAPAPARPYLALSILAINAHGIDETGKIEANNDGGYEQETIGQRSVSVRVTYYAERGDPRTAAYEMLKLQSIMRAESSRDALWQDGISILSDPVITNVPQLLQSEFQPQAVLDMTVAFATSVSLEVDVIERVEGQAIIDTYINTYTENFEVEI